ncbi:MAG: hypothetical protein AB7I41_00435 [Candidatus Sericytochromatia bacterium]
MSQNAPFTLLLTSVGSLLGQNMLDTLADRRQAVRVVGLNSLAQNPRNFRCDQVYLVPPTQDSHFLKQFEAILATEKPDLILAGRDDDVLFLTDLKSRRPDLAPLIPYGDPVSAEIMQDKLKSHAFAQDKGLAFVDSFLFDAHRDSGDLERFLKQVGFPLILKPLAGFGSNGVCVLGHRAQLEALWPPEEPLLLQPYLSPPLELENYLAQYRKAPPLFFQIPEEKQHSFQCLIGPRGEIGEGFCVQLKLIMGRVEQIERRYEPTLLALGQSCAKAFRDQGWRGSFNLQAKKDRQNQWRIFEFSPRMTGSLSARRLLGYDEMGLLLNQFAPKAPFPAEPIQAQSQGLVMRSLKDDFIAYDALQQLQKEQQWHKKSS